MWTHAHYFRHNGDFCPVDTKNVCQLFEIDSGSFADTVNGVSQPRHAKVSELFIEEWFPQLVGQKGDVLNNGLSNAPWFILCELNNSGEQTIGEQLDTYNWSSSNQARSRMNKDVSDSPVFTVSNLLIILSLTSGKSSFSRWRKRGKRFSIVASFPSKGARPLIWFASAARTCWEVSWERSRTQGTIRARMTSLSRELEKPKFVRLAL